MKLSAFILDSRESAWTKSRTYAAEGLLERVYIQAEHWDHAEANIANFAAYKRDLNPLGCKVYATMWCNDVAELTARIPAMRATVKPDGWLLNVESPPKENEGKSFANLIAAAKPEPIVFSYNVVAQSIAFDFRRLALRGGCEIHGQCYDVNGSLTTTPAEHITSAFKPVVCWAGGGGPAWWYRIKVGTTFKWAQVVGFNPGRGQLEMRTASGQTYWAAGIFDGMMKFAPSRSLFSTTGWPVGKVFGFAPYPKIGYTLATTRPISPEQLASLAQAAKAPGMAVCKKADLYTLENTTDEQFRALAGAA